MLAISVVGALALAVIAFPFVGIGGDSEPVGSVADPVPALPLSTERPAAVVLARSDAIEIMLPIVAERVTAYAFRAVDSTQARELTPNEHLDYEVAHLQGATGSDYGGLDVGAAPGTPVYSPVDGIVTAVTDYTVAGRVEGYEVLIEPGRGSSVAVRVSQISSPDGDTRPMIGQRVGAGKDEIGRVHDLSGVADLPLGRFTSDGGNGAHIEVLATGDIPIT